MIHPSRQRGAYLVMMALLLVVLVAVAALVLDIGRVLVLRSDMQAAADAAALAAAAELDGRADARERARGAARSLLSHEGRFARVRDLLDEQGLPDEAFSFYCVIGSRFDPDDSEPGFTQYCTGAQVPGEPRKYFSTSGADTNYVRVSLDASMAGGGRYMADLFFLPVLAVIGEETATEVGLMARALAGRSHIFCNYPPMAICDPFEGTGDRFRERMTPGGHVIMKQMGANQWTPGNFGFLQPPPAGPGAPSVARFLADEGQLGCTPPTFTTQTGGMTQQTRRGVNTRFDQYEGPPHEFNPARYPPAPNISAYPLDQTTEPGDARFGRGDWNFEQYWQQNHPPGSVPPSGWSNLAPPTRWDVYNWEINHDAIPEGGQPTPEHLYTGDYPPPESVAERRLLHVAVLSCQALGLTGGKSSGVIFEPDGFAKIFLTSPVDTSPDAEIHGEYVGWAGRDDKEIQVDIQLYE